MCITDLLWVPIPEVSEGVVQAPGEVEGQEAEHERHQHDDDHLHRLLLGAVGRPEPLLALPRSPAGLQQLVHHQAIAHHHQHEGQGEHHHGDHRTVDQEVIEQLRARGVKAHQAFTVPPCTRLDDRCNVVGCSIAFLGRTTECWDVVE